MLKQYQKYFIQQLQETKALQALQPQPSRTKPANDHTSCRTIYHTNPGTDTAHEHARYQLN